MHPRLSHVWRERVMARRCGLAAILTLSAAACCPDNEVREVHVDLPPGWVVDGKAIVDPDGNRYDPYNPLSAEDCDTICGGVDCEIAFECVDSAAAGGGDDSQFTCDPGESGNPHSLQVVCTVSYAAVCTD